MSVASQHLEGVRADVLEQPSTGASFGSWMQLPFLAIVFAQPLLGDGQVADWLVATVLVVAYLPLHFLGVGKSGRRLLWPIAGMAALGVVGLGFNSGASVLLIYAAALSGRIGNVRNAVMLMVALCGCALVSSALFFSFQEGWLFAFLPALIFVPTVGAFAILDAEQERAATRLQLAHDEVERIAAISERERIARDMHDVLGHTLTMIALKADLAMKVVGKDRNAAAAEMGEVAAAARSTLAEVRAVVHGYRSKGLDGEVEAARDALRTAGAAFHVELDDRDLPRRLEGVLALVLREGVTNIVRHAAATEVRASLSMRDEAVTLTLADNGRGGGVEGSGLAGIRERIEALGGSFSRRTEEQGTAIAVRLPIDRRRASS